MNLNQVREVYAGLAGIASPGDEDETFIQLASEYINCMIKPGASSANSLLVYACAADAFYRRTQAMAARESESGGTVKAGMVSVTTAAKSDGSRKVEQARKLREELILMAKDYLDLGSEFYFKEVV